MTALIGAEVHHGIGSYDHHIHASVVAKLVVVSNDLWILIVKITKASILVQYFRVFTGRVIRILCFALLAVTLPAACWGIFGGTFLCSPTAKLWKPQLPGHCMDAQVYWVSVAGTDIGLDFLTLLLPLPAITKLHLPRKQKISLVLVFLLGFSVCLFSVARLATVTATAARGHFVASGVWAIIWSPIEANVGIICASLLALKPLMDLLFPKLMQEVEPPKHSMRLAMVEAGETTGQSRPSASDQATLVRFQSGLPTTPTSMRTDSQGSSVIKKFGTARRHSSQAFGSSTPTLVEADSVEKQCRLPTARPAAPETLTLLAMLNEEVDPDSARSNRGRRSSRRSSVFTEEIEQA